MDLKEVYTELTELINKGIHDNDNYQLIMGNGRAIILKEVANEEEQKKVWIEFLNLLLIHFKAKREEISSKRKGFLKSKEEKKLNEDVFKLANEVKYAKNELERFIATRRQRT